MMTNVATYRIQDTGPGWKDTRFKVQIHIVGSKGQTVAFLETFRPSRQEATEAVADACNLYNARKSVNVGEKGFEKPEIQSPSEREALLAMSILAIERRGGLAGVKAEWAGQNLKGAV